MGVAVDGGVEQCVEPGDLLVGAQPGAGVQRAARRVERVILEPSVAVDLELDSASAMIGCLAGQADDVEGIHDRDRVGDLHGYGGPEAGEASIATTSAPARNASVWSASQVLNADFERPAIMPSRRAEPVLSRSGVRPMMTVTYLASSTGRCNTGLLE